MKLDIYDEMKKAIKDALSEWWNENQKKIEGIYSKTDDGETLLTIKQFCQKHTFISDGGIRSVLYCREYNKFNKCISKSGRRILIHEKKALEYFSNPPPERSWTYDRNIHHRNR